MKYNTIAEVYDLGPFITKLVLELDQPLSECSLDCETFQVRVVRRDTKTGKTIQIRKSWDSDEVYPSEGERKVCAAYVSDREGNIRKSGSFITLVLEVDPRNPLGAAIAFNGTFNVQVESDYTITQRKAIICRDSRIDGLEFTELNTKRTILADDFVTGNGIYQGIGLGYASFQPESNGKKRPLLIWLHGAGEGGDDPIIAISGNKVVNLISDAIQDYFDGSYVLAPQAPSMWMDDGTGQYNKDGSSMYVESLRTLIEEYVAAHDDIDRTRIYIGGCSNGGFMTLKMIIAYPSIFAAAFPICEALYDGFITDNDIERIKNIPIWFTHAVSDPIVDVHKHSEATYRRLINAGAEDVHFSCFHSVTDRTGMYMQEDRTPYEYNGHFSWIPALNNECILDYNNKPVYLDGEPVTLFEWLSKQRCKQLKHT